MSARLALLGAVASLTLSSATLQAQEEPIKAASAGTPQAAGRRRRPRRARRHALVVVEQYLDFAREIADHFVVMDRGLVVAEGGRDGLQDDDVRRYLIV